MTRFVEICTKRIMGLFRCAVPLLGNALKPSKPIGKPRTKEALNLAILAGLAVLAFVLLDGLLSRWIDTTILLGSYGALTVILVLLQNGEVARFQNVVGGHLLTAGLGFIVFQLAAWVPDILAVPLVIAASIFFMKLTDCVHPPAGAVAIIAVSANSPIEVLGWTFVPLCGLFGPLIFYTIVAATRSVMTSQFSAESPITKSGS